MHVIRDPLDILTRNYLASEPNATQKFNSSAQLAGFEAHLRSDVVSVQEMQAISESHIADPNYLRVRLEDLLAVESARRNATLAHVFDFLLDSGSNRKTLGDMFPSSIFVALAKAQRLEEQGSSQRKRLVSLLQRRPLKCHHVGKLQSALGYTTLSCPS